MREALAVEQLGVDVGIDTLTPPLSILTCFRAAEYAGHEHATEECLPRKTHQVQENTCIDHHNVLRLRRELTQRLRWNWWCSPGIVSVEVEHLGGW